MKSDLAKLASYSVRLFEKFYELYENDEQRERFHVGLGSFVDKRLSPASSENDAFRENPCLTDPVFRGKVRLSTVCVKHEVLKCEPNYVFRNNLPLANRGAKQFRDELLHIQNAFSSNVDFNEAGLDALVQAVVCQDQVNWRRDAATRKMIVYVSDAGFHAQGDGKLSNLYR